MAKSWRYHVSQPRHIMFNVSNDLLLSLFFNITTINYCDIALSIYDLTSVCKTLFNVYFYYYSFYLVIFSFVCNTIYVSGNTNKQSLLSMLTAIKHFLSSSEYYCVPPRGGAG